MGVNYNPSIVTNGLVLCLDAANRRSYPGSGTAWNDLSGNANHGTLTNGPTYSSSNGGSIVFDGSNDYVEISNFGNFIGSVQDFSCVFWVCELSTNANDGFVYLGSFANAQGPFSVAGYSGNFHFRVSATTFNITRPSIGSWSHVSFLRRSNMAYGYINGINLGSANVGNSLLSTSGFKFILGAYYGISYTFNGNLNGVCLYNRALSEQEIRQNYNATKGRYL